MKISLCSPASFLWLGMTSGLMCLLAGCFSEPQRAGASDEQTPVAGKNDPAEQDERRKQQDDIIDSEAEVAAPPTTAEELLVRIESGLITDQPGKLSPEESDKAVAILRKQYPFESIRDRLSFQSQEPTGPAETPRADRRDNRPRSLEALHTEEVQAFINTSGFGFNRGPLTNPYDLKLDSEYAERLISRPIDSSLLGEPRMALPEYTEPDSRDDDFAVIWSLTNGMPNRELIRLFHLLTNRDFASPNSTGFIKNLDQVAGFQSHRIRHQKDWDGSLRIWNKQKLAELNPGIKELDTTWRVNRLQLVSLLIHPSPRVYVSERLPNMEELNSSNAETRPLNDFEANGLTRLQQGHDVVTSATPNRIVMLGAIRAENSCLSCHAVEPDEVLGAFSYELLREPRIELTTPAL